MSQSILMNWFRRTKVSSKYAIILLKRANNQQSMQEEEGESKPGQMMAWIAKWANQISKATQYLEIDGTFIIPKPYVAFVWHSIQFNNGVNILITITPVEDSETYEFTHEWVKKYLGENGIKLFEERESSFSSQNIRNNQVSEEP